MDIDSLKFSVWCTLNLHVRYKNRKSSETHAVGGGMAAGAFKAMRLLKKKLYHAANEMQKVYCH